MEDKRSSVPDLRSSFARARRFAEEHMTLAEDCGSSWREETISEIVWTRAYPFVKFADFSRHQESRIGADWLWWWLDASGECFGMLTQAKRYFPAAGGRRTLDLKSKDGSQVERLRAAANALKVPSVYLLYLGEVTSRNQMCREVHADPCPASCAHKSLSILPSLEASQYLHHSPRDAADLAYRTSIALEDLVDINRGHCPVEDLNLKDLSEELRSFLTDRQAGARHVAQSVFSILAKARLWDFSAATDKRSNTGTSTPVFDDFPADIGHFGTSYFANTLRGLRREPPTYVRDFLEGRPLPEEVTGVVRGLVVASV
jgi:hypothetical protein